MRYTARLNRSSSGFVAQCVEVDAVGEGATRTGAIRSLMAKLEEDLGPVEGVAPPPAKEAIPIELEVLDEELQEEGGASASRALK